MADEDEEIIPLAVEEASIRKVERVTGRTRVHVCTEEHQSLLTTSLIRETAEVTRVPVGRLLDSGEEAPLPRTVDGVMVLPVLEEVPVVVKRLRIVEELHIRIHQERENRAVPVSVRRQTAEVEHIEGEEGYPSSSPHSPGEKP